MTEQARWSRFGYQPVPGLANRHISRYLRTQRKNMRRFFEERGLFTLADRMKQIRKSRQGMMAKNRYFQQVLNDYSKLVNPTISQSVPGSILQSPPAAAEATGQAENQ
jgi:hypothetical protein